MNTQYDPRFHVVLATRNQGKVAELAALLAPLGLSVLGMDAFPWLEDVEETGTTFAENARLKARAAAQATGLVALADDSGLEVDALDKAPGVYSARYSRLPDALDTHGIPGRPNAPDMPDVSASPVTSGIPGAPGAEGTRPSFLQSLYRPEMSQDERNIVKLLYVLRDVPKERRAARFRCCMVACAPCAPESPAASGGPDKPSGPDAHGDPSSIAEGRGRTGPVNVPLSVPSIMIDARGDLSLTAEGTWEGLIQERPEGTNGFGYDPVFYDSALGTTAACLSKEEKNSRSHRAKAVQALLREWPAFWRAWMERIG